MLQVAAKVGCKCYGVEKAEIPGKFAEVMTIPHINSISLTVGVELPTVLYMYNVQSTCTYHATTLIETHIYYVVVCVHTVVVGACYCTSVRCIYCTIGVLLVYNMYYNVYVYMYMYIQYVL